jgi:erythronate-4-phosphate dehydrogenase
VVDEKILQTYRKKLNGLILDVWENEPDVNTKMVDMADIATPHIAGYSYEGKLQGTQMIYDAACAFFFKEKKVKLLGGHGKKTVKIDVMESEDPVYDAVVRACPVLEDDARMRKIVDMGHSERSAYFDSLRQNYPERLEFNNYEVVCKKQYAYRLNVLGFKTIVKS